MEKEENTNANANANANDQWVPPTPAEIRDTRMYAGLTILKTVDLLCMSRNAWWRYETGQNKIPYDTWTLFQLIIGKKRMAPTDGNLYRVEDM